jgi:hypothetical protein
LLDSADITSDGACWIGPPLPRRVRYLPAYVEARRRIAGRTGKDSIGEVLSRPFVGRAKTL